MYSVHLSIGLIFLLLMGCSLPQTNTNKKWLEPGPLLKNLVKEYPEVVSNSEKTNEVIVPEILSLNHALLFTLSKSPELSIFSWKIKAAEARILQASLWGNPEFNFEVEEFGGEKDRQDFDTAEITIQFSQPIQLGGKISKKTKIASLERDLILWDYEQKRLEVFTATAKAFVEVLAAQEKNKLTKDLLDLANEINRIVKIRVDSGKVSPIELTRTNILVANSEIEQSKASRYLEIKKRTLSFFWGELNPKFQIVSGNFYKMNSVMSLNRIEEHLLQNPKLIQMEKEREKYQAIVSFEKAKRIPDINLDFGVRFFSETDDQALVAGFSLPIPVFDRNQGNILNAQSQMQEVVEQGTFTKLQIHSSLIKSYQILSIAREEIDKLEEQVLVSSQSALEAIRQGYQQGKFSYLEVLDAQRSFFEIKNRYIETLTSYHSKVLEIESLIANKITESKKQGEEKDEK